MPRGRKAQPVAIADLGTWINRQRSAMRLEHDRWRAICDELVKAGAVTPEDLKRNARDLSTPGCILLEVIRTWGRALVELEKANGGG